MPFGITSAPEVLQKRTSEIFQDLEGVDDILIWGKDEKEHNERLRTVLQRAREKNLKLNKAKSKVAVSEVTYVGHTFGAKGLKANEEKIKVIKQMQAPTNKKELQCFMGMVNYLSKFIPNLASVNKSLRELFEKEVEWHWAETHEESFQKLKTLLTEAPVLRYYDPKSPVTLSVDASSEGLGARMLQKGQPVAYSSRSLTKSEKNYAQIEKEMLAIVFGCTKFHQYVYGHKVNIESDHKPLEGLFKKPLSAAPPRVQRMMLRIQKYDVSVNYVPAKELYIADTLSSATQTPEQELKEAEESLKYIR